MPKQRKQNIQHKPMTKRQQARWQKEQQTQRTLILAVSGVLALAVIVFIAGILIDKVYVPNKTVATISGREISNAEYQTYRQITQAQRAISTYAQAQQFQQLGQAQGLDQFQSQIDADILALKENDAPLEYGILDQMIENQIVLDGAAAESMAISEDELKLSLGAKFPDPNPPAPTATPAISPTVTVSGTAPLSPTATPEPTATLPPTATPTLTVDQAQNRITSGLEKYYNDLKGFIEGTTFGHPVGVVPFSLEEFTNFIMTEERVTLLRKKLGEKLVTEDMAARELYADADQIFIGVTVPPTATEEVSATLWQVGQAKITAIAERLEKGADFDAEAAKESEIPSGAKDGSDTMQPLAEFANLSITEPVSTQQVGVIGEPYRSPVGWHIVRVNGREERASQTDLETKRSEALTKWIEEHRSAAGIVRYPEPTATPEPPTLEPALLEPTIDPAPAPTIDPALVPTAPPADGGTPAVPAATPTP